MATIEFHDDFDLVRVSDFLLTIPQISEELNIPHGQSIANLLNLCRVDICVPTNWSVAVLDWPTQRVHGAQGDAVGSRLHGVGQRPQRRAAIALLGRWPRR